MKRYRRAPLLIIFFPLHKHSTIYSELWNLRSVLRMSFSPINLNKENSNQYRSYASRYEIFWIPAICAQGIRRSIEDWDPSYPVTASTVIVFTSYVSHFRTIVSGRNAPELLTSHCMIYIRTCILLMASYPRDRNKCNHSYSRGQVSFRTPGDSGDNWVTDNKVIIDTNLDHISTFKGIFK